MSEWISVKDRLPKNKQKVIAVVHGVIDVGHISAKAFYDEDLEDDICELHWNGHDMTNRNAYESITYWMPLPAAPKEEV